MNAVNKNLNLRNDHILYQKRRWMLTICLIFSVCLPIGIALLIMGGMMSNNTMIGAGSGIAAGGGLLSLLFLILYITCQKFIPFLTISLELWHSYAADYLEGNISYAELQNKTMNLLERRTVNQKFFESFFTLDSFKSKTLTTTTSPNKKHQSKADKIMALNNLLKDGAITKTEFEKRKTMIFQEKD